MRADQAANPSSDTKGPLLDVRGLEYSYPSGVKALGGLDVSVGRGEVIAVVGPSGCGKSTLLSVLAGLTAASGGEISWSGGIGGSAPRSGPISMVFQRDTVFPWRTVEKNVEFGLECMGMPRAEREVRADRLIDMVGLTEFRSSHPKTLSGGMRRRLALIMSLAVSPQVLLLDEPFAALDEPTRVSLYVDLLKLVNELATSVVLVTHDIAEAITIADNVHILTRRPGRLRSSHHVPFGRDRDPWSIRAEPAYAEIYAKIWAELSDEISPTSEQRAVITNASAR